MADAVWTGYQALAWGVWRSDEAVAAFSGDDAERLWEAARAGQYPPGLGPPMMAPIAAEVDLGVAMQTGRLRYWLASRTPGSPGR